MVFLKKLLDELQRFKTDTNRFLLNLQVKPNIIYIFFFNSILLYIYNIYNYYLLFLNFLFLAGLLSLLVPSRSLSQGSSLADNNNNC